MKNYIICKRSYLWEIPLPDTYRHEVNATYTEKFINFSNMLTFVKIILTVMIRNMTSARKIDCKTVKAEAKMAILTTVIEFQTSLKFSFHFPGSLDWFGVEWSSCICKCPVFYRQFVRSSRCPLVFIMSDSVKGDSSSRSLFPKDLQEELNITNIRPVNAKTTSVLPPSPLPSSSSSPPMSLVLLKFSLCERGVFLCHRCLLGVGGWHGFL